MFQVVASRKSKTRMLAAGLFGASLMLVPMMIRPATAQESAPSSSETTSDTTTPGTTATPSSGVETRSMNPNTFSCNNNPNPICENPDRNVSETWTCDNNPGPDCATPPRLSGTLEEGSFACLNNQNVAVCGNSIRYTVDDPDAWPRRFSAPENSAANRTDNSTSDSTEDSTGQ